MAKTRAKAKAGERERKAVDDTVPDTAWVATVAAEHDLIAFERRAERRFAKAADRHAAAEAVVASRRTRLDAARQTLRERQLARGAGPSA